MNCASDSDTNLRWPVSVVVNGQRIHRLVDPRQHLSGFLRNELGCFGTRVGCEQGVCGACAVIVNGETVRGCLMLAAQADEATVTTIEGCSDDPVVRALQDAFVERNAMQCGFCTAGMILTAAELLVEHPSPTREQVREHISGNYCRCTGYQSIVDAVLVASVVLAEQGRS
jgi:carbon-monoxide dehydrogenase small subunit